MLTSELSEQQNDVINYFTCSRFSRHWDFSYSKLFTGACSYNSSLIITDLYTPGGSNLLIWPKRVCAAKEGICNVNIPVDPVDFFSPKLLIVGYDRDRWKGSLAVVVHLCPHLRIAVNLFSINDLGEPLRHILRDSKIHTIHVRRGFNRVRCFLALPWN